MRFTKYIKESNNIPDKLTLTEGFDNPDNPSEFRKIVDDTYLPITMLIEKEEYEEARKEIEAFESELNALEAENATRKFFKFPKFMINANKKKLAELRAMIPEITESIEDMHKRCDKCNTLLSDSGSCPKCDDGEEDYSNEIKEELSNREKLLKAYPELNFDNTSETMGEAVCTEELSNKEKLLRAFPELNFNDTSTDIVESTCNEELSVREKLKRAYPELNFDKTYTEDISPSELEDAEYDDCYEIEDDVEQDRAHAALYGGDRMYCDCGSKLAYDEYGSYCPTCNPHDPEYVYESMYDDTCEYTVKNCSPEMSHKIAVMAQAALKLPNHEVDMLEHDINNLRANEWIETFADLPDDSDVKKLFFEYAVECEIDLDKETAHVAEYDSLDDLDEGTEHRGNKWVNVDDEGHVYGTFDTKQAAHKQLAAKYASMKD